MAKVTTLDSMAGVTVSGEIAMESFGQQTSNEHTGDLSKSPEDPSISQEQSQVNDQPTAAAQEKEQAEINDVESQSSVHDVKFDDAGGEKANVEHLSSPDDIQPFKALSWVDRFLVLWIFLAMAIGIILANTLPDASIKLQKSTFVGVSVPIAVGLLVMMYPILCKTRFETLHLLFKRRELWKQLALSVVINWIVAPLLMTGLAWAFLPDKQGLREGLIFVGIARCIAMVLIWTDLAKGDTEYCAILVAVNSLLQMVLFAPLAIFFIVVVSDQDAKVHLPYSLVARSVAVFLGIPLAAAVLTRVVLRRILGPEKYASHFLRPVAPLSLLGLLYTIIVLFASQGEHVVQQITSVLRVCAPLIVYFAITFFATVFICFRVLRWGYRVSCTQSFTAASNNFELAIAVVVAVYGADSQQALASTVGPLIEVPVLVALVYVLKWFRAKYKWEG